MMNEPIRRPEQVSPKSSPRGSRSPAYPRHDSSGTLKTTISLGRVPSVIHSGPFYLMKDVPEKSEITGSASLMEHYGLEHSYNKFCSKKGKEELSAFLPNLPGSIDTPGIQDNSSLRSLIEKPPIVGKELMVLSGNALAGFRLHPGPLPEQYRFMSQMPAKKKHKHKRKREPGMGGVFTEVQDNPTETIHDKKKKKKDEEQKGDKRERKKKKKKKRVKEKDDESQS